jgi:hypothetical protein
MASESMSMSQVIFKLLIIIFGTAIGLMIAGAGVLIVLMLFSYEGFEGLRLLFSGNAW